MKPQRNQVPPHRLAVARVVGAPSANRNEPRPRLLTLYHGPITTTIWGNRTQWGDVQWRVTQVREYAKTNGRGHTTNFTDDDVPHLIQGLKDAQKILRRAKGELAWRRLFFWSW
jgi:hypothetical protein